MEPEVSVSMARTLLLLIVVLSSTAATDPSTSPTVNFELTVNPPPDAFCVHDTPLSTYRPPRNPGEKNPKIVFETSLTCGFEKFTDPSAPTLPRYVSDGVLPCQCSVKRIPSVSPETCITSIVIVPLSVARPSFELNGGF